MKKKEEEYVEICGGETLVSIEPETTGESKEKV